MHDPDGLQRFYWQNNSTSSPSTSESTTGVRIQEAGLDITTEANIQEAGQDLTDAEADQVLRIEDKEINDLLENDNYPFVPQDDDVDSDEIVLKDNKNESVDQER